MRIKVLMAIVFLSTIIFFIPNIVNAQIQLDTVVSGHGTGAPTTHTVSVTVGSHTNRILVVGATDIDTNGGGSVSSVKIGSTSFTKAKEQTSANAIYSSIWYLVNPPTGLQNITMTTPAAGGTDIYSFCAYSLYGVRQTTPIGATSNATSNSTPVTQSITPTHTGSWIIDQVSGAAGSAVTLSSPNLTQECNPGADTSGGIYVSSASQLGTSPTIGSGNTMSWTIAPSPLTYQWTATSIEVRQFNNPPTIPTISKVNTINSTAINATFTKPTGATFTLMNITLSGGATTHINTTSSYILLNNYTAGSKYTFQAIAGNSSGLSSASITKYNYTTNIAPTGLGLTSISSTTATISVTNPSGNFSGYKIEKESPDGGGFSTVTSNTGNTTNHYTLTGLSPLTQYNVRFSTNYAFGSNYSGTSTPSANFSFYTSSLPVGGKTQGFYVTRNGTSEPLYSKNLIGYWKLDGVTSVNKVEDYSSTKSNGTLTGLFNNATGKIGNAISFTGSNYISTSNSPYNFARTNTFSISVWLNYAEASTKPIYAKLSTSTNGGYYLSELATGHVQFVFQDTSKNNYTTDCGSKVNTLTWHNVIITFDGSSNTNGLKCYTDGVLTATGSNTSISNSIVATPSFTIGDWSNGGTGMTGTMDDLRIYNKLLSQSEITKISSYVLLNSLSKLDTYLVYDGKTYNYCIYPVNEYGQNDTGTCTTAIGKTYASPPNQLNGKFYKDSSNVYHVQLNWSKPSQFLSDNFLATGYKLQKLIGSTWTDIFSNTTSTSYTDSSLENTTTQKYRIFSYSHFGLSPGYIFENTNNTGLVTLYQFENNTLDSKGSNSVSFVGLQNYSNGVIGYGLALNGTSYGVSTNTGIPSGTSDRTISVWIKPNSFSSNSNAYISTGSGTANTQFSLIDDNGKIDCGGAGNNVNTTSSLTLNHWTLVTCVLSNSGQTRTIYLNGTLDKSSTTTAINSASSSLYIGTRADDTSKSTTGMIDNLRIYNSALNSTYVSELYKQSITSRDNSGIAGLHTLTFSTVGDITRGTSHLLITTGFPPPTIINWHLYNYSSVYNSTNVITYPVPNVSSNFLYGNWFNIDSLHNFKAVAVLSNGTALTLINSTTYPVIYSYVPSYTETHGVFWNYTISRPSPSTNLTLLANENPILFSMHCQIQTASDAAASKGNGWYNFSNVGYFLQSLSIHSYDNIYGTCYTNSSQKLFTFVSYGNSSLFPAINFMNQSYGAYVGVPVGVIFIVMAASLGNRRTAPMWVVIILAMAGIMSTLAFFTLNTGVWALALIAGLLALFVGRKFG